MPKDSLQEPKLSVEEKKKFMLKKLKELDLIPLPDESTEAFILRVRKKLFMEKEGAL